jgi:hypothetical protein
MKYRPQYCTIVVRNTDGSGYLRQFRTLSEAKDAYASISESGASVYLYQPPTRSLASFEAGSNVPDYNNGVTYGTGDQVKFQGKIYQLNNFIGAAGYTPASHPNQWTEVTSFTPPNTPPISSTGSEITENGITRSPFSFTAQQNLANSFSVEENCEEPLTVIIDSQLFVLGTNKKNGVNNGYGEIIWGPCSGMVYLSNGTQFYQNSEFKYYSNGSGGYYTETLNPDNPCSESGTTISSSQKTHQLYIVEIDSYADVGNYIEYVFADGNCGEYTVNGEIQYYSSGTQIASNTAYNFLSNGMGGYYSEPKYCAPYGEYISTEFGGWLTVYISELNSSYNAGSSSIVTYADGYCGTYTSTTDSWNSYGTFITSDSSYNYYSNGSGGYYSEYVGGGNNCDSYGTWLEGSNSDIVVNNPCGGTWTVGQSTYSVYADGNCGTYSESGNNYYSYETYLGNCNDYNYYSDGNGSYRQGEYTGSYPSAGTPTGNTSSGTNYLDINGVQYENGTYSATEFHDGSGGYYLGDYQYSYTSYGHYFGSQSYYDWSNMYDVYTYYYSDGMGGYYQQN